MCLLRSSSFWGCLHFWGCCHSWGHLHFWDCLHFWGHLYFYVIFIFGVIFIFEIVLIFGVWPSSACLKIMTTGLSQFKHHYRLRLYLLLQFDIFFPSKTNLFASSKLMPIPCIVWYQKLIKSPMRWSFTSEPSLGGGYKVLIRLSTFF